jgi:hypothetical protein
VIDKELADQADLQISGGIYDPDCIMPRSVCSQRRILLHQLAEGNVVYRRDSVREVGVKEIHVIFPIAHVIDVQIRGGQGDYQAVD